MISSYQESLRIRFLSFEREGGVRSKRFSKNPVVLTFVLKYTCVFLDICTCTESLLNRLRNNGQPNSNDHTWHLDCGFQRLYPKAHLGSIKRAFWLVATKSKSTDDYGVGWTKNWKNEGTQSEVHSSTYPQRKWEKQEYKPNSGSLNIGLLPKSGGVCALVFRAQNSISIRTGYKWQAQAKLIR